MTSLPPEIRQLMGELWADIERHRMERTTAAAKADPQAHKLSRIIEGGLSYRYIRAGTDGRGRQIRFCWSLHRNVAGYFLGWREVRGKKGGKRDQWSARRKKRLVVELAERRARAYRNKRSKELSAGLTLREAIASLAEIK